jgi:hypothetical protein
MFLFLQIFLAITLTGNIDINNDNKLKNDSAFASGTTTDRASFVTNVINFVFKFGLDGVSVSAMTYCINSN